MPSQPPHRRRSRPIGLVAAIFGLLLILFLLDRAADRRSRLNKPAEYAPPTAQLTESLQLTDDSPPAESSARETESAVATQNQEFVEPRLRMVADQLRGRDITDQRVLNAMKRVPRHEFVPENQRHLAYADHPLPIGYRQTISQPYIVALMTQLARTKPDARALDVGTGSGYQAAVLAELVDSVHSIEIVCPLAERARSRLDSLGYENVEVRCGDGYRGWPEHAPFDVIIVAAAPEQIPEPLIEQIAPGGRLVIPVGTWNQNLIVVDKRADGSIHESTVTPVRFVPMTGEAERQ